MTLESMSACDKLTMDTMINVAAYSKYMARKDSDIKIRSDETKSERRFYKKRIIELTKNMIKNPAYTNDSTIINACDAFINACIVHFKFVDLSDTIQMEHYNSKAGANDGSHANESNESNESIENTSNETIDFGSKVTQIDTAFLSEDTKKIKKINVKCEKNILEQLFISPEAEAHHVSTEGHTSSEPVQKVNKVIKNIPRVIEIDFKDHQFKTKGIKKTKVKGSEGSVNNTNMADNDDTMNNVNNVNNADN